MTDRDQGGFDEPFGGPDVDRLNRLLDELKAGDPPAPGLAGEVMARVRQLAMETPRATGGEMAKKVMWGLAAAAAILIAVFATIGIPPSGDGVEGTIGAAKRHRAQQMSDEDVKLGDPSVQAVLQSDYLARLLQDKGFRDALGNQGFRDALNSEGFRDALNSQGFRDALGNQAFLLALKDQGFRDALNSEGFRDALGSQGFRDALGNQGFRDALSNQGFRDALGNQGFRDALGNQGFRDALTSDGFREALGSQGYRDN